ncbi:sigma factor-like helix-turn-helix DNA-binding protein [Paenibacillus sp. FSL K6-3166]|uniref:sigma factor-like helix-turn-helix DNA-binding protein n=1 Tax=unclassified Paenibacillus TaxID=185978 RepID=UPI000BA1334A|nr:sigma factor-like helix-turn-helix DNA-binding protein [Paenibacillus sp. VTT E-133291]OZQ84704.1 RNA polymerase subunit sigma [Paenibacillus sp. VTT E-133291]
MGSVKIDVEKGARTYEVKYTLSDAAGVKKLLRDRHHVSSARFLGDYNAADTLIDLNSAINSAGLTERQAESIAWVYGVDLTQSEAAKAMGIAQQTVKQSVDEAAGKIAAVYRKWEYGEITVAYVLTDEDDNEMEAA